MGNDIQFFGAQQPLGRDSRLRPISDVQIFGHIEGNPDSGAFKFDVGDLADWIAGYLDDRAGEQTTGIGEVRRVVLVLIDERQHLVAQCRSRDKHHGQ
ncbi:Uncharacterised protein [Mycolicibacterium fortuitum]|uniref:Uncharacterized protein n=1 Tax=Mycolicibacterium fortuitum TaxID=1766 RepID=A0A378V2D2_MYCFO|nr:Uncharacterised protein [Mycolicibacterium fortuitum]